MFTRLTVLVVRLHHGGGSHPVVDLVLGQTSVLDTADSVPEAIPELLRGVVIDERVHARVEVGEYVPQDADRRVDGVFRYVTEVRNQEVEVYGQPEEGEDNDDHDEQTTRLAFLVMGAGALVQHRGSLLLYVPEDQY